MFVAYIGTDCVVLMDSKDEVKEVTRMAENGYLLQNEEEYDRQEVNDTSVLIRWRPNIRVS